MNEADRELDEVGGRSAVGGFDVGVSGSALVLRRAAFVEDGRNDDTDCRSSWPELLPARLLSESR